MRRLSSRAAVLASILVAGVWAAFYLDLDPARIAPTSGGLRVLGRFFAAGLRPALLSEGGTGVALLPKVVDGLRNTVIFAAAGMSLSLVLGVVLGFLASSAWWAGDPAGARHPALRAVRNAVAPAVFWTTRALITLMRSVHELLWALLFLCALGLHDVNAVIAIAIPYGGTLAKVFSEMIDEAPRDAAHALRGAGAGGLQVFAFGLLPRALPDMAAYAFYRFECALRSSAILGFFGFPTLGYFINASFENLYYREVWTYLYALFALVAAVDWWSGRLRRQVVAA